MLQPRVLLVGRGGVLDGAERQLCYLAAGLGAAGWWPVVALDRDGPLTGELRGLGVAVQVLPLREWRRFPQALWRYGDALRLARFGREQGVSVVHASDLWKARYALFAARQLKVPCVLHVRGPITGRGVRKHGLARAQAIITIAERYRRDLVEAGIDPPRVTLIDDAVEAGRFVPDEGKRAALRAGWGVGAALAVGIVGRVEAFKRVVEFMEMAGALDETHRRRAKFIVAGEAGNADYGRQVREAVARAGLGERVVFTGRMDDAPGLLSGLDILATLSGGSVMFEAMAAGRTVLSVRADGRHSLHTRHAETAWCVSTDQAGEAARALTRLLDDGDLRRRLGTAGRAYARRELRVERMVRGTAGVYERAVG